MAKTLALAKNCAIFSVKYGIFNKTTFLQPPVLARFLYSQSALGIDGYLQQRERTKMQFRDIADKFKSKMKSYTDDSAKNNMIFTEDLKNMIHIAETDEDFEVAVKMMKKFNSQNKDLRFGNFVFGPVIMRMFHLFDKPKLAYECFRDADLNGLFDQLTAYQILLDLMYRNGMYDEVLEAAKIIADRQVEGVKYPKNVVVLTMAACYKLNTQESFNYATELWKKINEMGQQPMRRAITFYAALALKQNNPVACLEIISTVNNQNYTTIRNLKVAAFTALGRVEDAIPVLKSILNEDVAVNVVHTFNRDVLDEVKKAVEKLNSPDVTLEFDRLLQIFEKQGHIANNTMDEQLCSEIDVRFDRNRDRTDGQSFGSYTRFRRNDTRRERGGYQVRPGLEELQ